MDIFEGKNIFNRDMPEKYSSMLRRAGKQMKQFNNENLTFIIQNFHRNTFIIL